MKSTRQKLKKIPGVPCLYRHEESDAYYGVKKHKGKVVNRALVTADGENITIRKDAERALADWIATLERPTSPDASMTLSKLLDRLETSWAGKEESTRKAIDCLRFSLRTYGNGLLEMSINEIKPYHLTEFFARRGPSLAATSFNTTSRVLKNAFEYAVDNEILTANPYLKVPKRTRRKKETNKPTHVPTVEQCQQLCDHIRTRPFSDTAERSADMLEFMHKAALGTAECIFADWSRVYWSKDYIETKRKKTGQWFKVPIYEHLKPFLVDMHERQGKPTSGPLFSIKSPKQALYNACDRLGLPRHSPLDFRRARISWMRRKGLPVELIAEFQGHRDNGVLIQKRYAYVTSDDDDKFKKEQLAKLVA